jgi:hypothetical protein
LGRGRRREKGGMIAIDEMESAERDLRLGRSMDQSQKKK